MIIYSGIYLKNPSFRIKNIEMFFSLQFTSKITTPRVPKASSQGHYRQWRCRLPYYRFFRIDSRLTIFRLSLIFLYFFISSQKYTFSFILLESPIILTNIIRLSLPDNYIDTHIPLVTYFPVWSEACGNYRKFQFIQ